MIDPDVRAATAADVAQLWFLESEARAQLDGARGGQRWLTTHDERAAGWPDVVDQQPVFVAHIGDVLVGYLVLSLSGDVALVDEVYVSPEAREVGFGDELLAAAVQFARDAGSAIFEGEALPGDRNTKNLYERAGITARLITVSTPLLP